MQSSVAHEKSFANKLLSSMSEIGTNLFATLESHCTMDREGLRTFSSDDTFVEYQCKLLCEKLNSTVALLASSEIPSTMEKELNTRRTSHDYKVFSRIMLSRLSSFFFMLLFPLILGYTILLFGLMIIN